MKRPQTFSSLLAKYIAHTDDLVEQEQACVATGELPDIARRAVALYGAEDAAKALREHFGVDVAATQDQLQ